MRNVATVLVLGTLWPQGSAGGEVSKASISVLVFDYAGVPAEILGAGLIETKRILGSGGVEAVWIHCPVAPERLSLERRCRDTPGPLTLVLQILPPAATRLRTEPGAGGFAVSPTDGSFGTYAGVFHGRIKQLGKSIGEAAALGHVVAHELGHLLLGTGRHSAGGIMKPDWDHKQIVLAEQGLLKFDSGQRVRIRDNIRRRLMASNGRLPESR